MPDLLELRAQIDQLDDQIVALLAQRMRIVQQVMHLKPPDAASIRSPERAQQVLERIRSRAVQQGMEPEIAVRTYRTLIEALTEMQLVQLGISSDQGGG